MAPLVALTSRPAPRAAGRPPDVVPRAAPRVAPGLGRLSTLLAAVVLGALVVGLVVSAHHRVTMAFGDSPDGRNAGVWAEHSRSLREQGPLETRMGTRAVVGDTTTTYATHPPLIIVEAAMAEGVLGERPWVTRLPAWAGSLAALVLAFLLLRECRVRRLPAAVGVALGFGCPMFATYGTMLDTAMVGLPFGIAVLWLWQRGRAGRPPPPPVVILVTVLAALSSWLGLVTAVLVAGATLLPWARGRLRKAPVAAPRLGFVVGAAMGTGLVVLWIAWAYGSLGPLADQFLVRSGKGEEAGGVGTLIATLQFFWARVFRPWQLLLAIPAFVAAAQSRHSRAVAVVAFATLGLWIAGLRNGAIVHDYWGYWMVLPLALGIGVIAEAALTACDHVRGAGLRRLGPVALAGAAAILGLVGAVAGSTPGPSPEGGQDAGQLLAEAVYPPTQRRAWVLDAGQHDIPWVTYQSGLPMAAVHPDSLADLAARAPNELVLAGLAVTASASCLPAQSIRGGYALVPATDLVRALHRNCP